jgi:hypothetical protein
MASLTAASAPKSDQLNADDLTAVDLVLRIEHVEVHARPEQPVEVFGVNVATGDRVPRPWRPCKTMIRVLAALYGDDSDALVGKTIQLYRDPTAAYGGKEVGGIRIRAAGGLDKPKGIPVTTGVGKRDVYRVEPLRLPEPKQPAASQQPADPLAATRAYLRERKVDDEAAIAYAVTVGVPLNTRDQRKAFALALTTEGSDHALAFAEYVARAADGGAS